MPDDDNDKLRWSRRSFLKLGSVAVTGLVSTSLTSTGAPLEAARQLGQPDEKVNEALRIASASPLVKDELAKLGISLDEALTTDSVKLSSVQESDVGLILEPKSLFKEDRGSTLAITVDLAQSSVRCLQIFRGSTWAYSVEAASVIYDTSRPAYEVPVNPRGGGDGALQLVQPRQEQQWSFDHAVSAVASPKLAIADPTAMIYAWLGATKGAWLERDKLPVFLLAALSESISDAGKEPTTYDFVLGYMSDEMFPHFPELDAFLPKSATPFTTTR